MIRDEVLRLCRFEERHRRLLARLALAAMLSLVVYVVGTVVVWIFERVTGTFTAWETQRSSQPSSC